MMNNKENNTNMHTEEQEKGIVQGEKKRGKTGKPRYWQVLIGMFLLILVFNLLACFRPFCDIYKRTVYAVISDGLGVLMGWIPVAIGELLMYLGAVGLLAFLLQVILLPFLRKQKGFVRFVVNYAKTVLFLGVAVLLVYTFNWVIPFRGSILTVKGAVERGYTLEEVGAVRDDIVEKLNACALEVERDEEGKVIYDRKAMAKSVFSAMKAQAGEYPLLSGYYPPMKTALCSDFLEWMDIGGYTYPYTMEVTWNQYCHDLYYPFLLAHESSHHQGYYQENEANFLAFVSLTGSDDPLLRYAGYNEIYYYMDHAYWDTLTDIFGMEGAGLELEKHPQVSERVRQDRRDASEASQVKYEAKSHPAQNLAPAAAEVADVGWTVQGDILQENSYDGVVKMVLQYYDVNK